MNEDAKRIYTAFMDGKTVQRCLDNEWRDENPFDCHRSLGPHRFPEIWRVKPEKRSERRWFKVYLNEAVNTAEIFHLQSARETRQFEKMDFFGGWLTRWLFYTVEVEQ